MPTPLAKALRYRACRVGMAHPGRSLDPAAAFPEKLSETTPLPEHFVVVRLQVDRVERLNLGAHPHQRTRWSADTHWCEQTLNP